MPLTRRREERGDELKALGITIRSFRAQRVLSQEEMGARCGLHRNYIGAIERGEINPTVVTLLKVTEALGITLVDLFDVWSGGDLPALLSEHRGGQEA